MILFLKFIQSQSKSYKGGVLLEGINKKDIKRRNRLLVLRHLSTTHDVSRTVITQQTHLVKMTVSNIINEMIATGVVCEREKLSGEHSNSSGRRQISLGFTPQAPLILGLSLSRDACRGIVVDMQLEKLAAGSFSLSKDETDATLTKKLVAFVRRMNRKVDGRISAIGVSAVGPLDVRQGVILNPPNFFGIHDYPLKDLLSDATGLPCVVQNGINASALAEKYFGNFRQFANFAYVGITNGVGSGIVLGNHLYGGSDGFAGEIGHLVIDYHGRPCRCGNSGCLETYVSVPVVLQEFEAAFHRPFSGFPEVCAFCEKNPQADGMLRQTLEILSIGLANLANCFDPEMLILGHEGALISDFYIRVLEQQLNDRLFARQAKYIPIFPSSFGCDTPLYGAAAAVLDEVFNGNLFYDRLFTPDD